MGIYNYECMDKQGQVVKGQLNADSDSFASQRLKSMGLLVLSLDEKRISPLNGFITLEKKVTVSELSLFSRQLSAMLRAGIPITRALYALAGQERNHAFKRVMEHVARNIEGGMNITEAFSAYPKVFPAIYISMLHSGELGGILDETLLRLSDQLQKDKSLSDSIKSATLYPRIILVFALLMVTSMLVFLVPVFKKFIPGDTKLPGVTTFIFGLSDSLRGFWYIWLVCIVLVISGFIYFVKSPMSKRIWDRFKFKIPVFGPLLHKSVIARFSRTLSTLLEVGIPVIQALESAGPTSGSIVVSEAVIDASKRIQEGKNISGPLEESGVFPAMVTQMIAVGEETGSLSTLLKKVAEFYEEEVGIMSKGLMDLLQPFIFIFLGVVVGGMLISLYLPIFTVVTNSGR